MRRIFFYKMIIKHSRAPNEQIQIFNVYYLGKKNRKLYKSGKVEKKNSACTTFHFLCQLIFLFFLSRLE